MWAWHKRRRSPHQAGTTSASAWQAAVQLLVLGLLAFCANEAHAQSLTPYAAKITGANKLEDTARALSVDNAGNVLVVGNYRSGTVTVADKTTLTNSGPAGTADIFLARFRADGVLDWTASWGGGQDDIVVDVVVEPAGAFAYVVGVFKSSRMSFSAVGAEKNSHVMDNVIFDPQTLPPNVFIVKISSAGKVIWTTQTGDTDIASVNLDVALERVYITGTFPSYLLTSNDDENWESMDQWQTSAPPDMDDDGGGAAAQGSFTTATGAEEEKKSSGFFDEDPFANDGAEGGEGGESTDIYVDYYSTTTGELVDGTVFTGDFDESPTDMLLEGGGEGGRAVVVAGFSESGDMRMSKSLDLRNTLEPKQGIEYGFVGKLDPTNMQVIWGKSLGVVVGTRPLRLAMDTTRRTLEGNVLYVTGTFGSPEMIALMKATAGGLGSSTLPTLLRMDAATGRILWVRGLPPTQQVGIDQNGGVLVAGTFMGSVSFSYDLPNLVASSANGDLYLARIDAVANGTVVQVNRFGGGSSGRYAVNDLQMDRAGNAYWVGNFTGGALTFANTQLATPGSGNSDAFAGRVATALRTTTPAPTGSAPPSLRPTPGPTTLSPTPAPTSVAWAAAQALLTKSPTVPPTRTPTQAPSTRRPSSPPSIRPTRAPTTRPSMRPSPGPPTQAPSLRPTPAPVAVATNRPTAPRNTLTPTAGRAAGAAAGTAGVASAAGTPTIGTAAGTTSTGTGGSVPATTVGFGGVPTAAMVDTSGTAGLVTGTSVDMVLTYAGQQSTILEFQRSLYQLLRPYATSYATFVPNGASRRLQEASSSSSSSSSSSPASRTLFFTELKRQQPSHEQQQQQQEEQEPFGRFLTVDRCGDSKAAKFSLPVFIEAKNRAATTKILGLMEDLTSGILALDNGISIFDDGVLCGVSYGAMSVSPLAETKAAVAPPQVVPGVTTSGASGVDGAAGEGCKGVQGLGLGVGFVLGLLFVALALGVLFGLHRMKQHRAQVEAASIRSAGTEAGKQEKFFTALDLSTSSSATSTPVSGGGSVISSPDIARVLAQEKEQWEARRATSLKVERTRREREHEAELKAAVAAAVAEEGDKLKEEHSVVLAAVRRSAAQGKGGVVLPGEKEKWEAEQEALISAVVAKEKEKWQQQQQQQMGSTGGSGGGGGAGGKEGGKGVVDAVTAERNRLTQEHITLMNAAEAKWQQDLAAEKERWEQGYTEDVTATLQEERTKWEAEQVTVLATQKQALKLRYAAALTTEMEKWEHEKASLLASMRAAATGDHAGATTAALLAEREKMMHAHELALKAAVAAEKERERQEREAELFAQKNMLKQRYGQAMMQEKEKWRQDALAAMEKERAAWEEEHADSLSMQRDILDPNHPSGVGAAIAAEREKWAQEHASSLAAALAVERERSKQEHATSLQASLAAQRKKLAEDHAKILTAALSGAMSTEQGRTLALTDARAQWEEEMATEMAAEKARWQQEHEAAMLAQKNELKLRYASVLAQEKEKWKNGGQMFTTAASVMSVGSSVSTPATGARPGSPQPPAEAPKFPYVKRGTGGGGGGGGGASPKK